MSTATINVEVANHSPPQELSIFDRMEALGQKNQRKVFGGALLLALSLHLGGSGGALALNQALGINRFVHSIMNDVRDRFSTSIELEELPPEVLSEPEPEEIPEPKPHEPAVQTQPVAKQPVALVAQEAPPAPAEAGKVLTAEPEPDEPLDLTADGFISGVGTRFAGGVTAIDGKSKVAIRNPHARSNSLNPTHGKTEASAGPPPIDKSRAAGVPVGANWNSCGFPSEATAEQLHQADVRVVVVVGPQGRAVSASVLSSPGFGFARHTQRCAMRFSYPVGLDKKGNPTTRSTKPFLVRFRR